MAFYNCGEFVGDDSDEVHFGISDDDQQALIRDYLVETYTLEELADEVASGGMDSTYDLTISALDYIESHSRNGRGPDFGGFTWSDDEDAAESDNRKRAAARPKARASASRPKASKNARSKAPARKAPAKKKTATRSTGRRY